MGVIGSPWHGGLDAGMDGNDDANKSRRSTSTGKRCSTIIGFTNRNRKAVGFHGLESRVFEQLFEITTEGR
jgi:hypothetical protein